MHYSTRRSQCSRLCWLALSAAPLLVEAAAVRRSAVDSLDKRDCTVEGNSDLYGLGVRLGELQDTPATGRHLSSRLTLSMKSNRCILTMGDLLSCESLRCRRDLWRPRCQLHLPSRPADWHAPQHHGESALPHRWPRSYRALLRLLVLCPLAIWVSYQALREDLHIHCGDVHPSFPCGRDFGI